MTLRSARRPALVLSGVALGGALALSVPLAASAHVHASAEGAAAGATSRVEFAFSHGCDGSPTTALVFDVPEGADNVTPVTDGAWTIARDLGDDGIATRITYTAVTPIEDGIAASIGLDVLFGADTADTDVAFPVTQQCETGETAWVEIAEDGQDADELEAPAPTVAVAAASDVPAGEHGEHEEVGTATEASATAGSDAAPVTLWLAGGALVVSVAALAVALIRRRA